MKRIDLRKTIMILANIGVIAGIVFLAFEVHQNTAQMRAEAALGIRQDLQRLNEAIYQDREFTGLVLRGAQDYESLDAVDQNRVGSFFFSELNLADLVSAFGEEGLSDVSIRYVDIVLNRFHSSPGRIQFLQSSGMAQSDFVGSALRSEEFYQRLLAEYDRRLKPTSVE